MRPILLALPCLLMAPWPAHADPPSQVPERYAPLRGADCLDPSMARSWQDAGPGVLLVDAGHRKYRITLDAGCQGAGDGGTLVFRGDAVSGRVCGNLGDQVQARGRACRIERIELVDAEAYRAATGGADDEAAD